MRDQFATILKEETAKGNKLATDLDLESRTALIREKKRVRGQESTRRVPLTPLLAGVLHSWLEGHPGGPHTFCHPRRPPRSKKLCAGLGPLTVDEANDHLRRALAGGRWAVLRGWHVFRHSFASNGAAAGVDQRFIDAWMGHQTEAMRRRYRHLVPDQQAAALGSVFPDGA